MDKACEAEMDWKSAAHDAQATISDDIIRNFREKNEPERRSGF